MKKCLILLVVCLMFTCCAALAEAPARPADDLVAPVFAWERDLYSHWQLDENNQPVNPAEHELDDMGFCPVCGSEVWDYGDGTGSGAVSNYDEHGNLLYYTDYENGELVNENSHILTYDENGVLARDLEFIGGVFFGEYTYTADAEGNTIPVKQCVWYDDGTSAVNEYDEYGNCVRSATFEVDGTLCVETVSEYAVNADGWFYECKNTTRFTSGATFYNEYNEFGDRTRTINTNDDGSVWMDRVYELEYADGMKQHMQAFENGTLVAESYYDEMGCNVKDIEYLEDGSYIVYTYDEDGETTETQYDAAGNPVA